MKEAATFTLGRSGDRRAVPALVKLLGESRASLHGAQTLACLGLAQIADDRVGPALVAAVKDASKADAVRAACAYGIGARRYAAGAPALLGALDDNRGDTQRLAAWALGQLGDTATAGKALGPLVRAYFARAGGGSSELVWAIGRTSGAGLAPSQLGDLGEYPMRNGKFNDGEAVQLLPGSLPAAPPSTKLLVDHSADIAGGLQLALSEHRDVVVSVLSDLDAAPDRLALGALTPGTGEAKASQAIAAIGQAIEPKVAAQLSAEDPKVRALAISVLAKIDSKRGADVDAAILKALGDSSSKLVRAAAMEAIPKLAKRRGTAPAPLATALAKMLGSADLEDRKVAALALGELGAAADVQALIKAAADPQSYVREAVAVALGQIGGAGVQATLETLAKDEEPHVRDAAQRGLARARSGAKP